MICNPGEKNRIDGGKPFVAALMRARAEQRVPDTGENRGRLDRRPDLELSVSPRIRRQRHGDDGRRTEEAGRIDLSAGEGDP